MEPLEIIAARLRSAGAVFSVHAEPLTSLSFIRPFPPGVLEDIARMTCVEELFLGGSDLTDDGVATLTGLTRLTWLELSDTRITNRAIGIAATLPQLQTLMLYGTAIDDACVSIVSRMPSLRTVGLDSTHISAKGLASLRKARPYLEIS